MIDSILSEYGPHATLVIVHNMSGEIARSELETFVDPLKRMVFSQARAKQWISDALFASTFPSSKAGDAQKRKFIQQVAKLVILIPRANLEQPTDVHLSLRGTKITTQVVKEWWMTCRGTSFADTS